MSKELAECSIGQPLTVDEALSAIAAATERLQRVVEQLVSSPLFEARPGYRRVICPQCGGTVGRAWDLAEGVHRG